jgi:hypothetical protein
LFSHEKPSSLEMPIEEITSALATSEGVSADNIEIQFCVLASATDNDYFAAGAIITNNKSVVFLFENSTKQITEENSHTASDGEVQAMAIVEKQLSKWTGNKILRLPDMDQRRYNARKYSKYNHRGQWDRDGRKRT